MKLKKNVPALFFLLTSVLFLQSSIHFDPAQAEQPNILLIMVDDMKDWVGYLGGYEGKVYTPNIDRLALEGVAFTNAHTAAPVCSPSRNAIMLGKLPSTTGLYNNDQWYKPALPNEVTLPQYFKKHGYYSAGAGKVFHHTPGNNPPDNWNEYQDQVFDDPWNFAEWSPERYFLHYGYRGAIIPYPDWKPLNGIYPIRSELDWGPIPGKKADGYGDTEVIRFAEKFLNKEHDKPFFLALGIYRPHLPWHVPQKYFDKYPLDEIVLPGGYKRKDLADIPKVGKELAAKGSRDFFQIRKEGKWKQAIQAYLASITFADALVGAILDALEDSKYENNTIVVFWSDHGYHLGSKNHWHKQTLWEEATRIPFIIKAPGVTQRGAVCDKPVDLVSVYPTLISLCNFSDKPDLDGHDLTPLLKYPDSEWKYPAITIHGPGNIAIRSQNWRYIQYHDGGEELYNHTNDPNEWVNLAGNEEYNEIINQHRRWIPDSFAKPVLGKGAWFFDPHAYTFMNRETGEFIDEKK